MRFIFQIPEEPLFKNNMFSISVKLCCQLRLHVGRNAPLVYKAHNLNTYGWC